LESPTPHIPREQSFRAHNFGGSRVFMRTPFNAEGPNLAWMERDTVQLLS